MTSFILLLAIYQLFQRFISTPLKWINKYKNRLTFAYYSLTLWDFKSLKSAPKTLQTLRAKNKLFKKMSTYRNTAFYDFKSRFLFFFFPSNYRHRLVWKIPFFDHFFLKILKYCTENLLFPSTSKYYAPPFISSCFPEDISSQGRMPQMKTLAELLPWLKQVTILTTPNITCSL